MVGLESRITGALVAFVSFGVLLTLSFSNTKLKITKANNMIVIFNNISISLKFNQRLKV